MTRPDFPGRDSFGTESSLTVAGTAHRIHRIADLAPSDLPYSLRVVLENLLRHEDGETVTGEQIEALLRWGEAGVHTTAIDLHPSRIFLHDTNGVPTLVDLAAMREAMAGIGGDPRRVNPLIPAELVVDHSVIADVFGRPDAMARNVEIEYGRNAERYRFLKWGRSSLENFAVVPPGTGIMHQVNLEYLARVVTTDRGWAHPDVCLGTDSHTTMVDALGVLGWGIGGIEAEAAMLGQSLSMLVPPVTGVRLVGELPKTATATDLVLTITELLRARGVVGQFVEFSGPGVAEISLADRATIANMSPEFGSTCAYFPIDDETLRYLSFSGRDPERIALVEAYAKEQGLWHEPSRSPHYSATVELDLGTVVPSLAGPRRPQDRVRLDAARDSFHAALTELGVEPGTPARVTLDGDDHEIGHGAVAIAAITSCTNTSNPEVMVAAGLLARNAVEAGLRSRPWVKTSLSPGSRVVTDYFDSAGLTPYLDELGFHLTGFGCMTCIGASGPLILQVTDAVDEHELSVVSVLSGNRNFDGRINPDVRMNYLASPPLVVAYALTGTMDIDLATEPLGIGTDGRPVHLQDVWPDAAEIAEVVDQHLTPSMFHHVYQDVFGGDERWRGLDAPQADLFEWDPASTYLRRPPYLDGMEREPGPVTDIEDARVLVKLGDSVTTDHVSPAGAIPAHTPAGRYLAGLGVERFDLNTYASRRGNHEVMMRGCFANVRLRNQIAPGTEGGCAPGPDGVVSSVYEAALAHRDRGTPLLVLAGRDYGSGSSRDWAAKGPALLGVRAVLAESFERIHRSNLIGLGVLPLQFPDGVSAASLRLTGHERYDVRGIAGADRDGYPSTVSVTATSDDGHAVTVDAVVRLDTPRERDYHRHGGIMRYVLRSLLPTAP